MIEDYYNQEATILSKGISTLESPNGLSVDIQTIECWFNNRGGSLSLEADKQTISYNATLKCDVSINIIDDYYIRHEGVEYKIVRINKNAGGYQNNHKTVYLEVNK
jgi:hypothetical protein